MFTPKNKIKKNGFHLIEMLIVLAIIAILAVSAIPVYSQHIVTEKRLEAASVLSTLAIALEKFHLEQGSYQGATLGELGFPVQVANHAYQLSMQVADQDYVLLAIPIANQAEKDSACGTLSLSASGEKSHSGGSGSEECW